MVLRQDLLGAGGLRSMLLERRSQGTLHPQDLERVAVALPT